MRNIKYDPFPEFKSQQRHDLLYDVAASAKDRLSPWLTKSMTFCLSREVCRLWYPFLAKHYFHDVYWRRISSLLISSSWRAYYHRQGLTAIWTNNDDDHRDTRNIRELLIRPLRIHTAVVVLEWERCLSQQVADGEAFIQQSMKSVESVLIRV